MSYLKTLLSLEGSEHFQHIKFQIGIGLLLMMDGVILKSKELMVVGGAIFFTYLIGTLFMALIKWRLTGEPLATYRSVVMYDGLGWIPIPNDRGWDSNMPELSDQEFIRRWLRLTFGEGPNRVFHTWHRMNVPVTHMVEEKVIKGGDHQGVYRLFMIEFPLNITPRKLRKISERVHTPISVGEVRWETLAEVNDTSEGALFASIRSKGRNPSMA